MFFRTKTSGPRTYLQVVENRWEGGRLVVLHISQGRSRAESIPGPGEIMHTLQT